MNVLLNLIAIKKGGGQQVATTFVDTLLNNNGMGHKWYILCTKGSEVHCLLKKHKYDTYQVVENNLFKRLFFEFFSIKRIVRNKRIDIIYTYGPTLSFNVGVPLVIRSAYSNLYFPEIKFWIGYPIFKTLSLKIQDAYRLKMTLLADGLILENESMKTRAIELYGFNDENTAYIKSSVTSFTESDRYIDFIPQHQKSDFKVLLLTGWHKNKNLELLPFILKELADEGINNISFIISISSELQETKALMEKAVQLGVNENISFIGSIESEHVHQIYKQTDAVLLLSLLECFSNNIIESWHFERPLIISDEAWARAICKNSAIYANRNDPKEIALKLNELANNPSVYSRIVKMGSKELETYNTPFTKAKAQINFLRKMFEMYSLH